MEYIDYISMVSSMLHYSYQTTPKQLTHWHYVRMVCVTLNYSTVILTTHALEAVSINIAIDLRNEAIQKALKLFDNTNKSLC